MSKGEHTPMGGYFELELPQGRDLPHVGLTRFQSARAAFLALLRAGKPKKVWMPRYICNAMVAPLERAGIECLWYELSDELRVDAEVKLGDGDWLLYVNYFGLCDTNVAELLKRFPPDQVVLDYSQSFFAPPSEVALATIYSPRKFFGVPDGGLLHSRISVRQPEVADAHSLERTTHLMQRLADTPESGYAAYQRAEESLLDCEPMRMSWLTERILSSIDFAATSKRRCENMQFLHERLHTVNQFPIGTQLTSVPLCYPFMTGNEELRSRLIANRVFVATYWPDAIGRVSTQWADKMVRNLLPLPIDQRYSRADMDQLASMVLDNI